MKQTKQMNQQQRAIRTLKLKAIMEVVMAKYSQREITEVMEKLTLGI